MKQTSPDAWIIDVDEPTFAREVLERSREVPVVVDFWARWCGPCRLLGPILEDLARERAGAFVLAKVDIDRSPGLAETYAVQSVPAVKAFVGGRPTLEFVGARPLPELRRWLDRVVPDETDRLAAEAEALARTDAARAEALLGQVVAQRPRHEAAAVVLARLRIARGDDAGAREVLRAVAPGAERREEIERLEATLAVRELGRAVGGSVDEARAAVEREGSAAALHRLGVLLAAEGRYPDALEALLAAAKKDKKLGQNGVREAMVQVFFAIGPRDPLSDRYRAELSRTIY